MKVKVKVKVEEETNRAKMRSVCVSTRTEQIGERKVPAAPAWFWYLTDTQRTQRETAYGFYFWRSVTQNSSSPTRVWLARVFYFIVRFQSSFLDFEKIIW